MILLRVRGLTALALLIVLAVGLPVMLASVAGPPVPDHLPTLQQISDSLTGAYNIGLFIGAMTYLAWLTWTLFFVALIVEIVGRLRGVRRTLPGFGGIQRLIASLLTSASFALSNPAAVAAASPSQAVAAAQLSPSLDETSSHPAATSTRPKPIRLRPTPPPADPPAKHFYRVRSGDNLWKIAKEKLDNPRRWTKLWKLNRHSQQPDGRIFTDPDLIYPGWKLRLPVDQPGAGRPARQDRHRSENEEHEAPRPPVGHPDFTAKHPPSPPAPDASAGLKTSGRSPVAPGERPPSPTSVRPTTPTGTSSSEASSGESVELPSGSVVTLAYVAGIVTAYAANQLARRRLHASRSGPETIAIIQDPEPTSPIQQLLHVHQSSYMEHDEDASSDADPVESGQPNDVPERIVLGTNEGTQVAVDLPGLGIGLTGQGATGVVRYVIADLLRQADGHGVEVIVCTATAARLFDMSTQKLISSVGAISGLILSETPRDACRRFAETHFVRRRMLLERDASTIDELRDRDPGEAIPAVLLVTDPYDEAYTEVGALLVSARATGLGAVILGEWPAGTTCEIDSDHRAHSITGPLADRFTHAQFTSITATEAVAHLDALTPPSNPHSEEDTPTLLPIWDGPELVRVSILGPPVIQVRGRSKPLELSKSQLSLLCYLAFRHPQRLTREQMTTALWPDEADKNVHFTLRRLRHALVTATEYANPDPKKAPFINASTTKDTASYGIDPTLISVDLCEYRDSLETARFATRPEDRLTAIANAASQCRGPLLEGLEIEWVDEHRYALTRSEADALSQYAALCESVDPEGALDALERARLLDPDTESTYIGIIRLQLRLARSTDARRTANLLREHHRSLGAAPSTTTLKRIGELLGHNN